MDATVHADDLPVCAVLDRIREQLERASNLIVCAPPGSGKTTRVPLALLDASWMRDNKTLLVLEPRRVATRAAARHMARLLGEPVGERVGYRVRFQSKVGPSTRIEVITEGILVRRLQSDPELRGVAGIVFDEVHERSLETDLGLSLSLEVQRALRPELRLIAMSATLDATSLMKLLGDAPLVEAHGRAFALHVEHRAQADSNRVIDAIVPALRELMRRETGDALVFVPGAREIRRVMRDIAADPSLAEHITLALHGDLPAADQDRALVPDPDGRRRIVVATNIAESALTIDGIRLVIDSGLARRPRFDPNTGLTRLHTVAISRASATQRAGRAARQGPGVCVRLWSEHAHRRRVAADPPAIADSDLAALVLELALWGVTNADALSWLDAPPPGALASARDLLRTLGALGADDRITALGREMAALPVHPRLAAVMVAGRSVGAGALACDLSALLEAGDLRASGERTSCDIDTALDALDAWRRQHASARDGRDPLARVARTARQLAKRLGVASSAPGARSASPGTLLLHGYPDRVAQVRERRFGEYRLSSGRAARVMDGDPLGAQAYLVVPDLDAGAGDGRIFRAAAVTETDLYQHLGHLITRDERVDLDAGDRVRAWREDRLGELVLARDERAAPDADSAADVLLDAVRTRGVRCLGWNDAARALRARIESVRRWCPDDAWPAVDDDTLQRELDEWLAPWLGGVLSMRALRDLDVCSLLRARLSADQLRDLETLAPARIEVPSGSRLPLVYSPGEAPVLAVKLQEMFGQITTPRVCGGRVAVMVHLLSPAGRPVQITQDLDGFWRTGYAEVRRELRGRYPKHPWPEDPIGAVATRRTRNAAKRKT